MLGGCINLNQNRQNYNLKCSFEILNDCKETLGYETYSSGVFYAKLENQLAKNREIIGTSFMISQNQMTISSVDDLEELLDAHKVGIMTKIYINDFEKFYSIQDIQVQYDKQQMKFRKAKYVCCKYYIALKEIYE